MSVKPWIIHLDHVFYQVGGLPDATLKGGREGNRAMMGEVCSPSLELLLPFGEVRGMSSFKISS